MEIECTLRPDDLQAFTRYHLKLQGGQLPFTLANLLVIVLISAGFSLFLTIFIHEGGFFVGIIIGWFGGIFFQIWVQMCKTRSLFKAQCEDPRGAWAMREVRVIIAPDQLQTIARGSKTTLQWSVVWHIGCTQKHVFLCITRLTAIIIPRRAFRDTAHCEEFVALARQYQQNCREQKPKPTGIITSLPPEPTAIRPADRP